MIDINIDIQNFLKNNRVAVLATANKSDAKPHAATVFYETDSHLNIFFLTKENTAKSRYLDSNPQAAMVVFDAAALKTAQINGIVSRNNNPEMMQKALRIMSKHSQQTAGVAETPISKLDAGGYVLYMLAPQAIRLADYKYGGRNQIFDTAMPAEESLDF